MVVSLSAGLLKLAAVEADIAQHAIVQTAKFVVGLPLLQEGDDPVVEFGKHGGASLGPACKSPVVDL
jgi:hypothetical protein